MPGLKNYVLWRKCRRMPSASYCYEVYLQTKLPAVPILLKMSPRLYVNIASVQNVKRMLSQLLPRLLPVQDVITNPMLLAMQVLNIWFSSCLLTLSSCLLTRFKCLMLIYRIWRKWLKTFFIFAFSLLPLFSLSHSLIN